MRVAGHNGIVPRPCSENRADAVTPGVATLQVCFAAALFTWSGGALTQATQWAQIA